MSKETFTIEKDSVINAIKLAYQEKRTFGTPAVFNSDAMNTLIEMQNITNAFFHYAWCQDYIEALLYTLRCSLFGSNYLIETQSEAKDTTGEPQTITMNRSDAGDMFHLINVIIKYLADMNFHNERFDSYTKATR